MEMQWSSCYYRQFAGMEAKICLSFCIILTISLSLEIQTIAGSMNKTKYTIQENFRFWKVSWA